MQHTHQALSDMPLRRFVVLTNKNEYIVLGTDNIEAGYRAINLAGLVDEELKDVIPCSEEDTRQEWTGANYDQTKDNEKES
ncbi:MAG: hypothetical protein CMM27_01620 [Rhodospirillaceae bacterium]|nr:hypothetical protein [Rhodospirillaceae bacterium]